MKKKYWARKKANLWPKLKDDGKRSTQLIIRINVVIFGQIYLVIFHQIFRILYNIFLKQVERLFLFFPFEFEVLNNWSLILQYGVQRTLHLVKTEYCLRGHFLHMFSLSFAGHKTTLTCKCWVLFYQSLVPAGSVLHPIWTLSLQKHKRNYW